MWPQILILIIYMVGSIYTIKQQFSKKIDNAQKADLIAHFLGRCVILALLYWGGFFDCFFHAH